MKKQNMIDAVLDFEVFVKELRSKFKGANLLSLERFHRMVDEALSEALNNDFTKQLCAQRARREK